MLERFMKPRTLLERYDSAPPAEQRAVFVDLIERHRVLEAACIETMDAQSLPELEAVIRRLPAAMLKGQTPVESQRDVCRVV
jgi:hypothetical protein